jgi:hypothetical protein
LLRFDSIGVPRNQIAIHPLNCPEDDRDVSASNYGFVTHGIPYGDDNFVYSYIMNEIIPSMREVFSKIEHRVTDKQIAMIFLRDIVPKKYIHLARGLLPTQFLKWIKPEYDSLQRHLLCHLLDVPSITDQQYDIACTNMGLSLTNWDDIIFPAFISSVLAAHQDVLNTLPAYTQDWDNVMSDNFDKITSQTLKDFTIGVQYLKSIDPFFTFDNLAHFDSSYLHSLQHKLSHEIRCSRTKRLLQFIKSVGNVKLVVSIESQMCSEASAWMYALPKTKEMTMTNTEFSFAGRNVFSSIIPLLCLILFAGARFLVTQ